MWEGACEEPNYSTTGQLGSASVLPILAGGEGQGGHDLYCDGSCNVSAVPLPVPAKTAVTPAGGLLYLQ